MGFRDKHEVTVPKIIAVDFDDTLATDNYPDIGEPIYFVIEALKEEIKHGSKIILWTTREDHALADAIVWCDEMGIELSAVNENLPEIQKIFCGTSRKIYADEYWDDKSVSLADLHMKAKIRQGNYLI